MQLFHNFNLNNCSVTLLIIWLTFLHFYYSFLQSRKHFNKQGSYSLFLMILYFFLSLNILRQISTLLQIDRVCGKDIHSEEQSWLSLTVSGQLHRGRSESPQNKDDGGILVDQGFHCSIQPRCLSVGKGQQQKPLQCNIFFDYVRFIFNNSTSFSYTKLSFNKKILDIKARKVFFIIYSLLISKADVFRNENHAFEIKVVSFI